MSQPDKQTTDLVQRLREASNARTLPGGISLMEIPTVWPGALEAEAASALERLQRHVPRLVALLREVRATRAADIVPDRWADRVDEVLQDVG